MFGKKKKNEYEEEVVEEGRDEFDVDYNDDEDFETDFVSLDEDEDEKPKRGGIGKKVGITFGVILAVLVVAYVGMAFYFDSHFMFNTTINGNNFALKSVAQVEKYMEQQVADYTLTLQESDGDSEQITGSEISLEYVPGDEVKELAKKQNKFLWITSLWEKPVIEAKIGVKYDENALARRIESLNCLKEENQVASVDAHPEFQNTEFVVVPEVIGTQIDTETFNKDIRESIEGFQDTLNLTDTNCYIKPRFLSDSQEVVAAKDTMNSYLGANVTYDFNPNTEVVDASVISQWVIVDADMNVTFNQEAVKEYIAALATKYNTSKLIVICILAYLGISIFAIFLTKQWQFWVLAVLVGMFQGGIQSLSRSYFTKIISLEKSGEYFGLMDVCGKGASFLGTTVVGVLSQTTGQINLSLGALSIFFMLGIVFFRMSEKREG